MKDLTPARRSSRRRRRRPRPHSSRQIRPDLPTRVPQGRRQRQPKASYP